MAFVVFLQSLVAVKHAKALRIARVELLIVAQSSDLSDHGLASASALAVHRAVSTVLAVALVALVVHARLQYHSYMDGVVADRTELCGLLDVLRVFLRGVRFTLSTLSP